jgi:hypothetical protein
VLQAVVEGFALRSKVDPTAVPQSSGSDLGPYAMAVAGVLAVVTRPADDVANLNEAIHVPTVLRLPGKIAVPVSPRGRRSRMRHRHRCLGEMRGTGGSGGSR